MNATQKASLARAYNRAIDRNQFDLALAIDRKLEEAFCALHPGSRAMHERYRAQQYEAQQRAQTVCCMGDGDEASVTHDPR